VLPSKEDVDTWGIGNEIALEILGAGVGLGAGLGGREISAAGAGEIVGLNEMLVGGWEADNNADKSGYIAGDRGDGRPDSELDLLAGFGGSCGTSLLILLRTIGSLSSGSGGSAINRYR